MPVMPETSAPVFAKENFANYRFFEFGDPAFNRYKSRIGDFVTYLTVYASEYVVINDLNCFFNEAHRFRTNYTGHFSINFTRKGYFTYASYRKTEEEYATRIMIEKPGSTYTFIQQVPGEGACTVFSFTKAGFEQLQEQYPLQEIAFLRDPDQLSIAFASTPEADLLHQQVMQRLASPSMDRLQMDCLIADFVDQVMHLLLRRKFEDGVPSQLVKQHVRTIEKAHEFLWENYMREVTLAELATYCCVSHFHFSRLFKQITGYTPFGYLQQIRLLQAETMMRSTDLPVTDVCYRAGFSRLDYFSAAFAKQFGAAPSKYRDGKSKILRLH
jgi:AraC family transcriptional regulator